MTRYLTGFNSLTNGAPLAENNHGGNALTGVVVGGGSLSGDTTLAAHGTTSLKVTPGNQLVNSFFYTGTGSPRVSMRAYVYFTQSVATGMNVLWAGIGNTRVVNVELRPNGGGNKLRVNDASSTTSAVYASTSALPFNQWVRLELDVTAGTTTSNGRIRFAMYPADSTTPIDAVYDSSTLNTGTANLTTGRWGAYSLTSDLTPHWLDDVAFDDAATGFIGPISTDTANLVVGSNPYYVIDARTSTGSPTPTYSLARVSGATLTFTEPVDGLFYVTQGSAAVYRVTMTAGTATDTEDITIPALATSTPQPPNILAPTGTSPGTNWA